MRVTTDARCRMQSRELFKPNTPYDGATGPDGRIQFVELAPKEPPVVKPRRIGGRLRGALVPLSRAAVAAAVRAERDAR